MAAALENLLARQPPGPVTDPWDIPDGWRPGEHAWIPLRLACAPREATEVRIRARAGWGRDGASGAGGGSGRGSGPGPGAAGLSGAGGGFRGSVGPEASAGLW